MGTSRDNDLWRSALSRLSESDRQNVTFGGGQGQLAVLTELQRLTEDSRDQCIKKRWRLKRPGRGGETIIIRDLFSKIVGWIVRFREIGDVVVQYDPAHAALPWAGVRFLLQIAVGDIVTFGFVVEGAEFIARMISRYALFEDIYLHRTSKAVQELQDALVRLYTTILLYLSKAKEFFEQNSAKRMLKAVAVSQEDFQKLAGSIDKEETMVDRCAGLVDAETRNGITETVMSLSIDQESKYSQLLSFLHKIDGPVFRMSGQLHSVQDHLDEQERVQILRWLSSQPYIEHHEQIFKHVLSGSGAWLLEDPLYIQWHRNSASTLLWLHGKVGSGKSTLVSLVIEDAFKRFDAGQGPPPVYFYCSRNAAEAERSDPAIILGSIVRQLASLQPGLPLLSPVIEKWKKKGQGFSSKGLQVEENCDLILELIEEYPMTTIVIDALDECDIEKRQSLLDAFESILQDSLGLVKIFVSSRDDQDIVCTLREYPNLDIVSDRNTADIESFVTIETERLVRKRRLLRNSTAREELKALIIDRVSKGADGMFLWASLQLEILCALRVDEDIRSKLGRLPPKLQQLYLEIYSRLINQPGEAGQSIVRNVLKWLLCARRQMKNFEFRIAVARNLSVRPEDLEKEHILDLCQNLVIFDDGLDVFRFAHLSVREFLEQQPEFNQNSCHALAAEVCMLQLMESSTHVAAKNFLRAEFAIDFKRKAFSTSAAFFDAFYTYAVLFCMEHCQLAGEHLREADSRFKKIFRFFLFDETESDCPLSSWARSYHCYGVDTFQKSFLQKLLNIPSSNLVRVYFLAIAFAFREILEECLLRPDLDYKARREGLFLAATEPYEGVLELFSKHCKTDNEVPENWLNLCRLYNAARDGDYDTITRLIQRGTEVDFPFVDGSTPLIQATRSSHKAAVQVLLSANADPNASDYSSRTAFYWAAAQGKTDLVEFLLDAGVSSHLSWHIGGF